MNTDPIKASAHQDRVRANVRFYALDAARWVASVQIVAYHVKLWAPLPNIGLTHLLDWGAMWTQMFFFLSGFVLAYAELSKPPKSIDEEPTMFAYLKRRLATIYPLYLFSMLLAAPTRDHVQWKVLPYHLLLVQGWWPFTYEYGPVASAWNGPSWFLSVLMVYWLIIRRVARFIRGWSSWSCVMGIGCLWSFSFVIACWQFVYGFVENYVNLWYAINFTWLGFLHVFLAGILSARLFIVQAMDSQTGLLSLPLTAPTDNSSSLSLNLMRIPALVRCGCLAGYSLYFAMFLFVDTNACWAPLHNGALIPIFLLVVFGACICEDPIAKYIFLSRPMRFLGRISYAQYLLQAPIWGITRTFFQTHSHRLVVFPGLLLLSSWLAHRFVEQPFNAWQGRKQYKDTIGNEKFAGARETLMNVDADNVALLAGSSH